MTTKKPFYKSPLWISISSVLGIIVLFGGAFTQMPKAQSMVYATVESRVHGDCDSVARKIVEPCLKAIDSQKCQQEKFRYNQDYMIELLKQMATNDQKVKAQNAMSEYRR
jgi:hypothetical protein